MMKTGIMFVTHRNSYRYTKTEILTVILMSRKIIGVVEVLDECYQVGIV